MFDFAPGLFFGLPRRKTKKLTDTILAIRWDPAILPEIPVDPFPETLGEYRVAGQKALTVALKIPLCERFRKEARGYRPFKRKWDDKALAAWEGHFIVARKPSGELRARHIIPAFGIVGEKDIRLEFDPKRVQSPAYAWYLPKWDRRFWFLVEIANDVKT